MEGKPPGSMSERHAGVAGPDRPSQPTLPAKESDSARTDSDISGAGLGSARGTPVGAVVSLGPDVERKQQ